MTLTGIFAHEFFHIARVHLDWQRARFGAGDLSERGLRRDSPSLRSEEVRFLEVDADLFAVLPCVIASPPTRLCYDLRARMLTELVRRIPVMVGVS
jgi:hypothetical protein